MTNETRRPTGSGYIGRIASSGLWVLVLLGLGACTSPPAPAPAAPLEALALPPLDLEPLSVSGPDASPRPAAVRLLEATRVSVSVQDADLPSVLLGLGRESPLNVVVDRGVVGRLTMDLRDVSLLDVLDYIVSGRDYRYSLEGGVLRISPIGRETRIYRVEYPNYVRQGSSDLALAGFIGAVPAVGEGGASGDQDSSLARVTTTHHSDFWREIELAVRTIVFGSAEATTDEEDETQQDGLDGRDQLKRRVFVSRQSAIVSATAEPAVLEAVERYLEAVAESLEYQVLIDAQFVEITLGDGLEFGIDYEIAAQHAGVFARLITPGMAAATLVQTLAPTLNEGGIQFGYATDDFGMILRALATQTDVRVVSTPRITTLNNHKALIKVVRNEVFFIGEVDTVATDQTVLQNTQFRPQVVPVGVTLDVTPHVSSRSEITLHIRPSVSEIVDVVFQPTTNPDLPQNGSLPVVDLRESDSVVRVADGTTIAIGGLVRTRKIEKERSVPFFGAIPGLGLLFKRVDSQEVRTELVIFLTPHILDPPRIEQVTATLGRELGVIDELRGERTMWPWWRRPFLESYEDLGSMR